MLFTVALLFNKKWIYQPTTLIGDVTYSCHPSVLKFTHIESEDSATAMILAERLFAGSSEKGKWVDPKNYKIDEVKIRDFTKAQPKWSKQEVVAALVHCGWNKTKAAKELDVERTTLYRYIRNFELESPF